MYKLIVDPVKFEESRKQFSKLISNSTAECVSKPIDLTDLFKLVSDLKSIREHAQDEIEIYFPTVGDMDQFSGWIKNPTPLLKMVNEKLNQVYSEGFTPIPDHV